MQISDQVLFYSPPGRFPYPTIHGLKTIQCFPHYRLPTVSIFCIHGQDPWGGGAVCIFSLCSLHFLFGLAVMTLNGEKNKECCLSVIYHKINAMSDLNAVRKKKEVLIETVSLYRRAKVEVNQPSLVKLMFRALAGHVWLRELTLDFTNL